MSSVNRSETLPRRKTKVSCFEVHLSRVSRLLRPKRKRITDGNHVNIREPLFEQLGAGSVKPNGLVSLSPVPTGKTSKPSAVPQTDTGGLVEHTKAFWVICAEGTRQIERVTSGEALPPSAQAEMA